MWVKATIGEITRNLNKLRVPLNSAERQRKSIRKLYPYIGANNIIDYIDEYIFDERILCVAEDGGSWGPGQQCAVIYEGKTWVNNHAHVLVENGKANLDYLRHFLNRTDLTKYITGTTRGKLTRTALDRIEVPLPPLLFQIRIADTLNRAEAVISQRKESLRLLDEFLKSTFLEMFGDPVRNEKGWKKVRLSEICSKIGSGATPRGGKESYKSEGIKLIRSMNVHNNTFIFDGLVFIDEAQASKLDHVIVKPNDVLLNITGASVGRCCLAPKEVVPARVNQHVSIIRPDSNVINPVFLSRVLTNTHFQAQIVKEAKLKGATREAITKEEIERMEVPLPNKRFQSLFATIVEKTELLKARQQHSLKELSTLYGSLSQRAFQGELDLREEPLANAAEPEVVYHKARK